jgi:hypothetical protein
LRRLRPEQLRQVADELRAETISAVSVTGGHLGAGLGVMAGALSLPHDGAEVIYTIVGVAILALGHDLNRRAVI